ncbi:MAG: BamA/TamA family outer membrane protein [Fimbriimonadaceae bacterium]
MIKDWMRATRGLGAVLMLAMALLASAQDVNLVREIEVRGLVNVNQDQVLLAMRTRPGQPYVAAQLEQDKRTIEDLGFFSAVDVRAREVGGGNWDILVEVVEFPRIKEIRIVGNTVVTTEAIEEALRTAPALPIEPGAVFNLRSIRAASEAVRRLYTDRGYFAQIEEFGPMAESPETINVAILELMVNRVSVQGATRTQPRVLNRLIKTRPDTAFNSRQWVADLRRLFDTQWFEKVDSIERPTDDPGRIDLIADVKEQRTGLFNVGLQLDPRNNLAGFLRYSDSNFRGSGQSLGVGLLQGATGGTSVDLNYANPIIDDRDTTLAVSLYSRVIFRFAGLGFGGGSTPTDDDRYFERRTGGTVSITRPLRLDTVFLTTGVRFESIKTSDLDTNVQNAFIQQDGEVGSASVALTFNRRDTSVDPSRGDWLRISVEPGYSNIRRASGAISGSGILGSNFFLRNNLEYRAYFSPGQPPREKFDDPRRVIAVRARYGFISGQVPFFEQFFAGGSDTLRGYPEDRFWGRNTAGLTVEYRQPIQRAFNVIAFADYAGAWGGYGSVNLYTQSSSAKFNLGYGIGFSFRTPLGPLRLDFGFNEEGKSRTHFLIGTSF